MPKDSTIPPSLYNGRYWRFILPLNERQNLNFIENVFKSDEELTRETAEELVDTLADINQLYHRIF
jgi:hypothetical protein